MITRYVPDPPRYTRARKRGAATVVGAAILLAGCQWLDRVGPQVGSVFDSLAPWDEKDPSETGSKGSRVDRSTIRRVQVKLKRLGYGPGNADGIVGRRTEMAIRRYQRTHRLPITGRVSKRLIGYLDTKKSHRFDAKAGIALKPNELPAYRTWTTFVYSDGRVERVTGLKGEFVRWARDDETTFTAHRNFLLPWSYWTSVGRRGVTRVDGEPGDLWPLAEGETVSFSAWATVRYGDDLDPAEERVERWRCRNDGKRSVTVRAGTFKTVVFTCARRRGTKMPELVRTWYYAPSIRHPVRVVERYPDEEARTQVDLVGMRPGAPGWPPIARAALERAVVQTLSTTKDGDTTTWASSGVRTRVTIRPASQFVDNAGRHCRAFVQTWSGDGRRARYPAVACKNASGGWEIPGLGGESDTALAISAGVS